MCNFKLIYYATATYFLLTGQNIETITTTIFDNSKIHFDVIIIYLFSIMMYKVQYEKSISILVGTSSGSNILGFIIIYLIYC